jgi:hypothetical protein
MTRWHGHDFADFCDALGGWRVASSTHVLHVTLMAMEG